MNHTVASDEPKAEDPNLDELNLRIQQLVHDFRTRLRISSEVVTAIVEKNERLASTEPSAENSDVFLISLDQHFLIDLSDEELAAVVAHELGHVWIFTHHPYLHTEALANRTALKVVSREVLEAVYEKVWKHNGQKGTIEYFPRE